MSEPITPAELAELRLNVDKNAPLYRQINKLLDKIAKLREPA